MDVMQAILEIEKKANGIKASANELKENHHDELKAELAAKESEYKRNFEGQCEELRRESFSIRNEEMEKLEKTYATKLETLERKCAENKDKWVDMIVDAVIER